MARTSGPDRGPPRRQTRCLAPRQPSTKDRAVYSQHGCTVFGWPSTGGVIVRGDCDIVELKWLGWDPLEAPGSRDQDQAQEDAFCTKLKMIGGKWWTDRQTFQKVTTFGDDNWSPDKEVLTQVYVGWPESGGVLVLEETEDEMPSQIGMLRLVTTMEERCRLLRDKFGATHYEDPMTYAGFTVLVQGEKWKG